MKTYRLTACAIPLVLLLSGCDFGRITSGTTDAVSSAAVEAFLPAGSVGGGVLVPGTLFPPDGESSSTLHRDPRGVEYTVHTTGLPEGVYTAWIAVFDKPENCAETPCMIGDLYGNPVADVSMFWTDGAIVGKNGEGSFRARLEVDYLPDDPDQIAVRGDGLQNPAGAEVQIIITYHGPASGDSKTLYEQLHTLKGGCMSGANALSFGAPVGIQCFSPQIAYHVL